MASVQGLAGAFFDSSDPKKLAMWYQDVLGLKMEAHPDGSSYYHVFETRDLETKEIRQNPVFAINQAKEPLAENGRGFQMGLRVDNFEAYMQRLRAAGVEVEDDTLEWEGGKHGWVQDLDGNRVEIYEEIFFIETD